jgi:hypothetical protein
MRNWPQQQEAVRVVEAGEAIVVPPMQRMMPA